MDPLALQNSSATPIDPLEEAHNVIRSENGRITSRVVKGRSQLRERLQKRPKDTVARRVGQSRDDGKLLSVCKRCGKRDEGQKGRKEEGAEASQSGAF